MRVRAPGNFLSEPRPKRRKSGGGQILKATTCMHGHRSSAVYRSVQGRNRKPGRKLQKRKLCRFQDVTHCRPQEAACCSHMCQEGKFIPIGKSSICWYHILHNIFMVKIGCNVAQAMTMRFFSELPLSRRLSVWPPCQPVAWRGSPIRTAHSFTGKKGIDSAYARRKATLQLLRFAIGETSLLSAGIS